MIACRFMNTHFTNIILKSTGATAVVESETIQRLWSGYGKIVRCSLEGSATKSVVAKHVHWPDADHHPRGWNSDLGHEREMRSLQLFVDEVMPAGNYRPGWNGRGATGQTVASGSYFAKIEVEGIQRVEKLVLLK